MRAMAWRGLACALGLAVAAMAEGARAGKPYDVEEKSIAQLTADMAAGKVTSEALVRAYEARIAAIDRSGPTLRSVIVLNPHALADAGALDAERRAGHLRGPLHGVPVLIKDNIESADDTATTAGSLALAANVTNRDAPLVRRLTDAGAVILGKTNLSEWANIRSSSSISGWSAIGGLVKNPYALDRGPGGSSSGTGAAIAASLAAAGVGTETDGSVTCPAAFAGLVGLKPTVGLVSRTHIVPISHVQDTAGPMARSVEDAALLLAAMAGSDPADAATKGADAHRTDYAAALAGASLKGKRLGVLGYASSLSPAVRALFDHAKQVLIAAGAEIVEIDDYKPPEGLDADELAALLVELKVDLDAYLASTPAQVKTRTLADIIAFNRATPRELVLFDQDFFEKAQASKGLDDPDYVKLRERLARAAGPEGLDKLLAGRRLDALIAPSFPPAGRVDVVRGNSCGGASPTLAAIAGYPHLTVPMGQVRALPVGLSFIGPAWSEAELLRLGYAFEQRTHARRPPTYARSVEESPDVEAATAPAR
jgi:amidase